MGTALLLKEGTEFNLHDKNIISKEAFVESHQRCMWPRFRPTTTEPYYAYGLEYRVGETTVSPHGPGIYSTTLSNQSVSGCHVFYKKDE